VQLQVFAGNVRSLDWRSYSSDFSAPTRKLDLARDGAGPHVFELTERTQLRIALEDLSTQEPRLQPWVKVIAARAAAGGRNDDGFANARRLPREWDERYTAIDLTPGAYVIGAGRTDELPEVTATIEVGAGTTEASLQLGDVEMAQFLVVRCTGSAGELLTGVQFSSAVAVGQGGRVRSGTIDRVERPGGEYWLARSKVRC
jgi:hypothetical protein